MGTVAFVGVQLQNGEIVYGIVREDGYPDCCGHMLVNEYAKYDDAVDRIREMNVRALAKDYGDYMRRADDHPLCPNYIYLMRDGEWLVCRPPSQFPQPIWGRVKDVIDPKNSY